MQPLEARRALKALGDYAFELETGRSAAAPETTKASARAEREAQRWERRRLKAWRRAGRVTADGVLRVGKNQLKPYTFADVARLAPQLGLFDRLAALIVLDGVVERDFMSEHENIRAVVETIADQRLERQLQDAGGGSAQALRQLVRAEVAAVFGELLASVRAPEAVKTGGQGGAGERKLRLCSKCRQPGHRASTCPGAAAEPAAAAAAPS